MTSRLHQLKTLMRVLSSPQKMLVSEVKALTKDMVYSPNFSNIFFPIQPWLISITIRESNSALFLSASNFTHFHNIRLFLLVYSEKIPPYRLLAASFHNRFINKHCLQNYFARSEGRNSSPLGLYLCSLFRLLVLPPSHEMKLHFFASSILKMSWADLFNCWLMHFSFIIESSPVITNCNQCSVGCELPWEKSRHSLAWQETEVDSVRVGKILFPSAHLTQTSTKPSEGKLAVGHLNAQQNQGIYGANAMLTKWLFLERDHQTEDRRKRDYFNGSQVNQF